MDERDESEKEWESVQEEGPTHSKRGSRGQTGIMIFVGVLVIMALVWMSQPVILRAAKATERTEAINNAKMIGLALLDFDQEYGSFPEDETVELVRKATKTKLDLSGGSSNAMFRQLIANGIQSELIFYCLHPETHKPDGDLRSGEALVAGEVGFSYLAGQNTSENPGKVVLLAPMKIGTQEFYAKPFNGRAVLLRIDNSVEAALIREEDGKALVGGGETLFDTGAESVWGKVFVFDLRHPEK